MKTLKYTIYLLFIFFISFSLDAQSELELKEKADKLFLSEQFVEASPLFLRLLAINPRSTEYNFKYGTCLLYNSSKKQEAIKYLNFAITDANIDPLAYYYLGKAYQFNFQFNDAIKEYTTYLQKAGSKARSDLQTERQIETCQNGKKLMTTITDIIVINKTEIDEAKFYDLYKLDKIGGQILVTTDFQSKIDKKKDHVPLVYFPSGAQQIFYASYGESEGSGLDIYIRRRIPGGAWGDPQKVAGYINTNFDENYAFMDSKGKYLYFSSKGHNSMGGYDVFRARYNEGENRFEQPENMDFAVSSPDDDIFYMVDADEENAYFASARQSTDNKLYVYRVLVDRVPTQLAIVKGDFKSQVEPGASINITIIDYASGLEIGKFNSDDKKSYLLTFPKGGKYEYIMQVNGSGNIYKAVVSIPFLKVFKPLKQAIVHEKTDQGESIRIIDMFDQEVENAQSIIAQVFKNKSELNVNVQDFDLNKIKNANAVNTELAELGLDKLNLSEISDLLKSKEATLAISENSELIFEQGLLTQVLENNDKNLELNKKIKELTNLANKANNNSEKQNLLLQAKVLIDQQQELVGQSKKMLAIADSLKPIKNEGGNVERLKAIEQKYATLVASGEDEKAIDLLKENKTFLKTVLEAEGENQTEKYALALQATETEISKISREIEQYQEQKNKIRAQISTLEGSLSNAKKKEQESIQKEIDGKKEELNLTDEQISFLQKKLQNKQNTRAQQSSELSLISKAGNNKTNNNLVESEVKKAFTESNSTNSNTLNKYVLEELAKVNALLNEVVSQSKTYNNYQQERAQIENNNNLSRLEKSNLLSKLDNDNKRNLENEIEKIEQEITRDPNNSAAIKERDALKVQKEKIEEKIKVNEQNNTSAGTNEVVNLTQNDLLERDFPLFSEQKSKIENNKELDKKEKQVEVLRLEEKLLIDLKKQLIAANSTLESDTKNKSLVAEISLLENMISEYSAEIEDRKTELNNNTDIASSVNTNTIRTDFEKGKELLESDLRLKNEEKITLFKNLKEESIQKLDLEQKNIEKELLLNPNNQDLKNKLNEVKNVKSVINAEQIKESQTTNPEITKIETEQETRKSIDGTFNDKIAAINKNTTLTSTQKTEQKLNAEKEFLTNVRSEIKKVETIITSEGPNEGSLKRKENLENIRLNLENSIDEKEQLIASNSQITNNTSETTTKKEVLESIFPKYEEKLAAIKNNPNSNSQEKKAEELFLKTEYLAEINMNINNANSNSTDPKDIQKIKILEDTKAELEIDVKNLVQQTTVDIAEINSTSIQKKVNSNFEIAKENIEADVLLNDSQKKEKTDELLDQNIVFLEKNQIDIENKLSANPDNNQYQRELEITKQLIEDNKEEKRINSTQVTSNITTDISTKALIENLNPNYTSKENDLLNTNALSESDKLKELIRNDKELSILVEKRIAQLEKDLNSTPEKTQEISSLIELKTEIETKIVTRTEKRIEILVGETEQEAIISNLDKNYASKIASAKQKGDIKEELALETGLKSKLEKENAKLNSPTTDEQKAKKIVLEEIISKQTSKIEALNNPENILAAKSIEDIKKESGFENENIESLNPKSVQDLKKDITKLDVYISKLNTEIQNETKSSNSDEQKIEKLQEEKILAENKKQAFSISLGELEQVTIVNNTERKEIATIKKESGFENENIESLNPKSVQDLKKDITKLDVYISKLNTEIQNETKSSNSDEQKIEKLQEEKILAENKKQAFSISLGELEQEVLVNNTTNQNFSGDSEINRLSNKENDLQNKIIASENKSEQKSLNKELDKVQEQKYTRTTEVLKENIEIEKVENQTRISELNSQNETTKLQNEITNQKVVELQKQANNTKDNESKNYLLEEALALQKENNIKIQEAVQNEKIAQLEKENDVVLLTANDLEKNYRKGTISIGELEFERDRKIKELNTAPTKQKVEIQKEIELLDNLIAEEKSKLTQIEIQKEKSISASTLNQDAKETKIEYKEEIEIAESKEYKSIKSDYDKIIKTEAEIKSLENKNDVIRKEIQKNIANNIEPNQSDIQNLKANETKIISLRTELSQNQTVVQNEIKNSGKSAQIENLLSRGVDTVSSYVAPINLMALPLEGIKISEKTVTNLSPTPIAVDVKNPSGLVFRVQIGAFSRPIPESTFSEFNPVSGEKLANGITRYMAGYFGTESVANKARLDIRDLGYSDAFLVAYCDGQRISIAEARRLQSSGECIAQRTDQIVMEASNNTAVTLGVQTTVVKPEITASSYNKAPGAAPADAVEDRKGLFFTVQIGVYNKPVGAGQLKNIQPLVTNRLDNGQIRYSSGIFLSASDAQPKRQDAIARGISDAFIVAYYQGKRLTVGEANKLIAEKGDGILEDLNEKPINPINLEIKRAEEIQIAKEKENPALLLNKNEIRYQLVSEQKYPEYPRDLMENLNKQGTFVYREADSSIYSIPYKENDMPDVSLLDLSFEQSMLEKSEQNNDNSLVFEQEGKVINGDLNDYLLRLNINKIWKIVPAGLELQMWNLSENEMVEIKQRLLFYNLKEKSDEIDK